MKTLFSLPLVTLLVSPSAFAVVHRVPSEYVTIQEATDVAAVGDTVLVAPGTYSDYSVRTLQGGGSFDVASMVFLKAGVSLVSEGGSSTTTLDMLGEGEADLVIGVIAYVEAGAPMHVEGFRITGVPVGYPGMFLRSSAGTVLRDCVFDSLDGGDVRPGGLRSIDADVELYNCRFLSCAGGYSATRRIGGLDVSDADVLAEDCLFEGCSGGASVHSGSNSAVFRRCVFRDNAVGGSRAGLGFGGVSVAVVEQCVFHGNSANTAAALDILSVESLTVQDNLIFENTAAASVAGMVVSGSQGVIRRNTFYGNTQTAVVGGTDLLVFDGPLQIENNIFSAASGAPAVLVLQGSATASCNLFWDNQDGDVFLWWPPDPQDIFADPQLCNPDGGDFTVDALSPCLPEHSGGCGQIGALGQGCGSVSVSPLHWSVIKNAYRGEPRKGGAQ